MNQPPYCPIHEFERACCDMDCLQRRAEFRRIAQALRVYWYHRKKGMPPVPEAVYLRQFAGRWDVRA